jgi:hypothetical protein
MKARSKLTVLGRPASAPHRHQPDIARPGHCDCQNRTRDSAALSAWVGGPVAQGIDTTMALDRFEQELVDGASAHRRAFILAILERWRDDGDLTGRSRLRARELSQRFCKP